MRSYVEQTRRDVPDLDQAGIYSLEHTHLIATTVERAPSGVGVARMFVGFPLGNGRFGGDEVGIGEAQIIRPIGHPNRDTWVGRCTRQITMPERRDELIDAIAANIQLGA